MALGLRVESSSPGMYATNISINSEITITFNSELNTRTIPGNVLILEDVQNKYVVGNNIVMKDYEIVEGAITYKDKVINFKPTNQLNKKSRYIIYVIEGSVCDILGNVTLSNYISYFDTEVYETYAPCDILEPLSNSVLTTLTKIVIEDLESYRYIYQISKSPTFENVILEEIVDGNIVEKDFTLGDGLYYVRAKAENGEAFGDYVIFSIKSFIGTTPTDEDVDEEFIYTPYEDDSLELLVAYPENGAVNVNVKTNVLYMKFNKILTLEDIDFYEAQITGTFEDNDDQFNTDSIVAHGDVDGSFVVVYDEENSETYIFFSPDTI